MNHKSLYGAMYVLVTLFGCSSSAIFELSSCDGYSYSRSMRISGTMIWEAPIDSLIFDTNPNSEQEILMQEGLIRRIDMDYPMYEIVASFKLTNGDKLIEYSKNIGVAAYCDSGNTKKVVAIYRDDNRKIRDRRKICSISFYRRLFSGFDDGYVVVGSNIRC